ncbi:MAG: hypothetical protein K8R63_13020, partial [Bacteroidales bacterium]|nr:hypothetical protein [Bacteroidales bacterium]
MKNKSNIPVFLFMVILAVISCKRSGSDKELLFWSSNNAQEITFTRQMIDNWNRAHPAHPIRHQPVPEGQSSEEIILAAVVGKTTPDIYANMFEGSVEMYA